MFAVLWVTLFALQQRFTPRLLRLRFLKDGESVAFPLVDLAIQTAAERKEIEEEDEQNPEPTADAGPAWKCKSCGEENPGNFNECWKCLKMRDEAEASK